MNAAANLLQSRSLSTRGRSKKQLVSNRTEYIIALKHGLDLKGSRGCSTPSSPPDPPASVWVERKPGMWQIHLGWRRGVLRSRTNKMDDMYERRDTSVISARVPDYLGKMCVRVLDSHMLDASGLPIDQLLFTAFERLMRECRFFTPAKNRYFTCSSTTTMADATTRAVSKSLKILRDDANKATVVWVDLLGRKEFFWIVPELVDVCLMFMRRLALQSDPRRPPMDRTGRCKKCRLHMCDRDRSWHMLETGSEWACPWCSAACVLQTAFREAISNPSFLMCRRRLIRECEEMFGAFHSRHR